LAAKAGGFKFGHFNSPLAGATSAPITSYSLIRQKRKAKSTLFESFFERESETNLMSGSQRDSPL
jgi:hypothetical protein